MTPKQRLVEAVLKARRVPSRLFTRVKSTNSAPNATTARNGVQQQASIPTNGAIATVAVRVYARALKNTFPLAHAAILICRCIACFF